MFYNFNSMGQILFQMGITFFIMEINFFFLIISSHIIMGLINIVIITIPNLFLLITN